MSLKRSYKMLSKLADTSSTNEKVSLLKKFLQDEQFKKVILYTLDERLKYNIKQIPKYQNKTNLFTGSNKQIFKELDKLSKQTGASNLDKQNLFNLASIDQETYEVVARIVKKDLRCGCSAKLVNNAIPCTIAYLPYMRCSTDKKIKNIKYDKELGAIVQEKGDGTFVAIHIDKDGEAKFYTRNFSKVHQLHKLKAIIRNGIIDIHKKKIIDKGLIDKTFKDGFLQRVYHGEMLVRKNGNILDRKTGNGIINQCIQKTALQSDADCIIIKLWDSIPEKDFWKKMYCDIQYNTRLRQTMKFVSAINNDCVQLIETQRVFSYEEAQKFYSRIRKEEKEGAILKNAHAIWKDGTSTEQIKMKNVSDAEMRAVEWKKGEKGTKYEKYMGAVLFETDDKKVQVWVGSGFSDAERKKYSNKDLGKISTIEFESLIKDKNKDIYSLYLPRHSEQRFDRNSTDTLESLKNR